MPTEWTRTSEASTTSFKDDTLELKIFYSILDEERLCKIFESLR